MFTFILLAIALTAVAVALVVVPLLRSRSGTSAAWPTAAITAAVVVLGAATLYPIWSNWTWPSEPAADDPQRMVARLARRLEREPNDINGWLMLGRSYVALERYPQAIRAYEKANDLAQGQNFEALIGLAEALALQDETELAGRAGQALEQALALQPKSPKALFYGAAAALRRGELDVARKRFSDLLALNPPDNVKPILQAQIDAIDAQLAGDGASQPNQQTAGASAPASVRVTVHLAPALAQSADQESPLFVIVRDPSRPGPPLAAKKLASRFPQTVELTPSDAMLAGRSFSAGQQVEVIARISRSGQPTARSGDPYGQVAYRVGQDGLVDITIDRLTP